MKHTPTAPPEPAAADDDMERQYTTSAVARLVGVTTETVRNWITAKQVQASQLPTGHWRIPEREVRRLVGSKFGGDS